MDFEDVPEDTGISNLVHKIEYTETFQTIYLT